MKKNNSDIASHLNKMEFAHLSEDNRFIQWISQHGLNVLYGLLAVIAIVVIGYRLLYGGGSKGESDYYNAENDYQVFAKNVASGSTVEAKEQLTKLQAIIQDHPELHAKYDGLLAQGLLNLGDVAEAQPYAARTLERTRDDKLPFYSDYASTTLLIAQQNFSDALKKAEELKQKMLDNAAAAGNDAGKRDFGDILFAFNMLRIAMLEQQIGDKQGELQSWQELKRYAKWSGEAPSSAINPLAFQILLNHFEEGKVSLLNYIDAREKVLKAS